MKKFGKETAAPSRRHFLAGAALSAAGATAGCGEGGREGARPPVARGPVPVHGAQQAGVVRPGRPQDGLELMVFDLGDLSAARRVLADLGGHIGRLARGEAWELGGLAPADLTVTVGVGPRVTAGVRELPPFSREDIPARCRGGDLMVQVCGSDPLVVSRAAAAMTRVLRERAGLRWRQSGFRVAGPDRAGRNLLGFHDGVVGPSTEAEQRTQVWTDTNATVAVLRRIRVDLEAFLRLPVPRQEQVIGRRRADGAPLSGGTADALVDLTAKTADGHWLIPADAHVRRAHPQTAGTGLMLRRGYSYDNGPGDSGLMFVAFQREQRTFEATQRRLDLSDRLMAFTTTTAGGAFLVLPGFDEGRPLGSSLDA